MRVAMVVLAALLSTRALSAQIVETPIPFDSARRVLAITPAVAQRFQLGAPAWTVLGEYREARLYSAEPGDGFVLVVHRPSGALERRPLTSAERVALGAAIDAGMTNVGRPSVDVASDVVSEPAGSAFARHQTLVGAAVYGPLAAPLADEGSSATAAYLLVTGASFFISYSAAQSNSFTRAQSDLAGNLGLAAAGIAGLLGYSATGDVDKGVRGAALGAALVGTVGGIELGRSLSDAEAHSATLGMGAAAVATWSATSMAGLPPRGRAAAVALVGALGYPVGVRYPRRASYTVTAGDIGGMSTVGFVGATMAAAFLGQADVPSEERIAAYVGTGYLAGLFVGDRLLARRYDLTRSQSMLLNVGAIAGGLVGVAFPVLGSSDDATVVFGSAAVGATLGMGAVARTFRSNTAARRVGSASSKPSENGTRFTFQPSSLAAAAGGIRGNHVLGRLSF